MRSLLRIVLVTVLVGKGTLQNDQRSGFNDVGNYLQVENPNLNRYYNDRRPLATITEYADDTCNKGLRQSPVDLTDCKQVKTKALRLKGHNDYRSENFLMLNTGSTVQVTFRGQAPTLFGGPLSGEYTFLHMYLVWGSVDGQGSAHAINGYFGAMEAHFVHFKTEYNNYETAITHEDGLAIVAIIFVSQVQDNPKLDRMIAKVKDVQQPHTTTALPKDAMLWMNDFLSYFNYYSYSGSLITHPCKEVVTWILREKSVLLI